jgi:hypothetical protein
MAAMGGLPTFTNPVANSELKQPPGGKTRLPSHETGFDLAHPLNPARYRDNAGSLPNSLNS